MKIAALKERATFERRAAITPETTKLFLTKGFNVSVEKNIGLAAGYTDNDYEKAGAKVSNIPLEIISDANIILKVQPSPLEDHINEIELAKKGAIIIGLLSPVQNRDYISKMISKGLYGFAMEQVPRTSKAQTMDALSSQSNLAGYRAAIEAIYYYESAIPMMTTAAGTIAPAKALVLGAGVAGLQAIATLKRMGAIVSAYDVRSATREQVESLGAKFISPNINKDMETTTGYAQEYGDQEKSKQQEFLQEIIKNYSIVITTALIPNKPAPMLIDSTMVSSLKTGSVIVDMAVSNGGNVAGSKMNEIVSICGIKIIGWSNLASRVATDSSKLYAKNLFNLINYCMQDGKFNLSDDLIRTMQVS